MGKHSQSEETAQRRAAIGGMRDGREAGRQIVALNRLLNRAEGADVAAATRKTQQATDVAWPPDRPTE